MLESVLEFVLENLVLLIFKAFLYYWFLNWDFRFCLFFFSFSFFFFAFHFLHYVRWVWMDGILYWEFFFQEQFVPAVLQFVLCSSTIFQSSWENKFPWKKKKKTGRRESFRNKTYIFFGNDIFFHSDFWFQINCFNELVRPNSMFKITSP